MFQWFSKQFVLFKEIADVAYRRKHGRPVTSILVAKTDR